MHAIRTISVFYIVVYVLVLTSLNARAQIELVENGSFETGDFSGWTVVQEPGGEGDWFVYTAGEINILPPPPVGDFAAATEESGSSSQVLFQDIDIPGGSSVTCSVIVYYANSAFEFVNGPDLSYLTFPNQQARIDIMDPDAPDFDIGSGVLLNVFQTNPGDPFSLGYTAVDFDLSQFAGSTVRFRAAEVDNIFVFNFAIDNVTCDAILIARPIPTLSEWGLIAMAGVLGILGLLAIRRRKLTA